MTVEPLEHDMAAAESGDGAPVVVLLHGRGADRRDLLGLRPHLPKEWALVVPDAPFQAAPWGYGPGRAWYRYLDSDRPEPESFAESQHALDAYLDELPGRLPFLPGPLVLGGFSQGGTMSLGQAIRRAGGVPLAVNFSGFLPDHPEVHVAPETVADTTFFWGHGRQDPAIPFTLAEKGRAALEAAGARLEARDYPIGHWIAPEELSDVVAWIRRSLPS